MYSMISIPKARFPDDILTTYYGTLAPNSKLP